MTLSRTLSPQESADRLAIRQLVDTHAHRADRRDLTGRLALFTPDTHFVVHMDAASTEPTQDLRGRDALVPVFDNLNSYTATTHFNGQSRIAADGDHASGESCCLAHHLFVDEGGRRMLMVASIRYLDEFVRHGGDWLYAERRLMVDWTETRTTTP